ncbi:MULTISPECIES: hypothetical protein [Alphaproteobacteria]|nr:MULTISPECIES: hypothetical protein [Rhodospirillales]
MTALFRDWIAKYPIVSFKDGLAEDPLVGCREQRTAQERPDADRR